VAGAVGAERVLGASVVAGLLGCAALLLTPAVRGLRRENSSRYSPVEASADPD
jgi:hypothetical protein